jgi:hypothetical protein
MFRGTFVVVAITLLIANTVQAQVQANFGSVAAGRDIVNSVINIGVDDLVKKYKEDAQDLKQNNADLRQNNADLRQFNAEQITRLAELQKKLDLNERQIRSALFILGETNLSPDQLAPTLVQIASQYKLLRDQALTRPTDSSETSTLKNDARKAIDAGDLAGAEALLAKVEDLQRAALLNATRNLAAEVAETAASRGEVAMTRLRYVEAATHFASAGNMYAPAFDSPKALDYLEREADALYLQGEEFGDDKALHQSIERRRALLERLPRDKMARDWARNQHNLGLSLDTIAQRSSGAEPILLQSIEAYRDALQVITRDKSPLDWANIQSNLGSALAQLEERSPGSGRMEEAIAAYQEALKECSREKAPLQWGGIQTNLAAAYLSIAETESGTESFELALKSFDLALQEVTRERDPAAWGTIQNDLGSALSKLATRNGDQKMLASAIDAYRASLAVKTRERYPYDWATTTYNLAGTLSDLAKDDSGVKLLDEAAISYRAALQEITQERSGLVWARAQTNLGNVRLRLGRLRPGTADLEAALAAYTEATKEWTIDSSPLDWAMEQDHIGDVLFLLAIRTSQSQRFQEAADSYRQAMAVNQRANRIFDAARNQADYCVVLWLAGDRTSDESKKSEAQQSCQRVVRLAMAVANAGDRMPAATRFQAAKILGDLTYKFVFVRDYDEAVRIADFVIPSFPELSWVQINKAHALMLSGKTQQALEIYQGLISGPDAADFKQSIRTDFQQLRSLGLNAPLMETVEKNIKD